VPFAPKVNDRAPGTSSAKTEKENPAGSSIRSGCSPGIAGAARKP